ncbi:Uncharacterised protein [Mycobacteroides abscessus subsp. massiliense]|nr:Uncharacterised protein [Mycobacteroides abscessus subsp. massiliense]
MSLSRIVQRMAELAAAVRLVYRCDAALLIVRQWLDKLADLERQVTGVVDEFMSEQILTNGHTDAGLAGSTRNQQGARARNRRGGAHSAGPGGSTRCGRRRPRGAAVQRSARLALREDQYASAGRCHHDRHGAHR